MIVILGALAALAPAALAVESDISPDYSEPEAARDYQTARTAAIGLAAIGIIVSVAGMALGARHYEGYLQHRRVLLLCVLVFVVLALDKVVAQGVAGWFLIDPADLPVWWR